MLSEETQAALWLTKTQKDYWTDAYRTAVLEAVAEGSFSVVAEATGLSKDTLQRWKREAGK